MSKLELINFTDTSLDERKMILTWRNNPKVKKWMYTSDDILLENHLSFIESLSQKSDKLYFLVKENTEFIGVIDFINITTKSLDIGIYANPDIKGKGSILLNEIINYSFDVLKVKKINSEVFSENEKAHDLYKKFKFQEVGKKIVNGREVICMELIDENR